MVRGSAVHTAERNLKKRIRTTNCSGKGRTNEITKDKRRCRCVGGGRSLPGCGRAAGGAMESAEAAEAVWRRENNKRGRVWRGGCGYCGGLCALGQVPEPSGPSDPQG
jgi:hypothetical protein